VLMPVCPEQLGNLSTPRQPAEILGGTGLDVIKGNAKVMTEEGGDVTRNFIQGAAEVLDIALKNYVQCAVFKERSPSCGCRYLYDGTFSGKLIRGGGVTTALLKQNQIPVFSEEDLTAACLIKRILKP